MTSKQFNLATDPWIKVIDRQTNHEKMVSLNKLFEHAADYRQLAGEMHSQDLAVFRLLLAILTTVYSRVDADNQPYEWIKADSKLSRNWEIDQEEIDLDDSKDDLMNTWETLYQGGRFTAAVTQYLKDNADCFNFFGDRPFYQVTKMDYDAVVPAGKRIDTHTGQVAVRQINRQISQSGNTPAIFAPKSESTKDDLPLDELVRWVITYQNFTGVTDKTKIVTKEAFSKSAGWIYHINPVFAKGQSLFETLMLNLILDDSILNKANWEPKLQKPVWEYHSINEYVQYRIDEILPNNLAELYTSWSRLLHIEWRDTGQPTIYSAGMPMFDRNNAFIEPMTTWKRDKKTGDYQPVIKSLSSLGTSMWQKFGQYVNVYHDDKVRTPGIVKWLWKLQDQDLIKPEKQLVLNSIVLVSGDNQSSQMPAIEIMDDMQMQTGILFDSALTESWPIRIEDAIKVTQVVGADYRHFVSEISQIRNIDVRSFATDMSAKFYERLNEPFKKWLLKLNYKDKNKQDQRLIEWKRELNGIVLNAADEVMQTSSLRDIKGIPGKQGLINVFTAKRDLMYNLKIHLKLPEE